MPNLTPKQMVTCCQDSCAEGLEIINSWEQSFCESIERQIEQNRSLSLKQMSCLEKIFNKLPAIYVVSWYEETQKPKAAKEAYEYFPEDDGPPLDIPPEFL